MLLKFIKLSALSLSICLGSASQSFSQTAFPDSITLAIAPEYNDVSNAHRYWFGENYRTIWATPVKMRVFNMGAERGGMKILKQGGGQQTKSLRLEDADGNEWVLRTIQKDPGLALPENLRATVAKSIVQDQISASHPFGALVVPPLAKALGVPHANPEVVYLPDDQALGEYRKEFAEKVYLFEEREPLLARDTDNTEKVLEELEDDNDNRVEQTLVLRARLLDIVIGDWDRHDDQWRWVEREDSLGDLYLPLPRDRDQVFFVNTGVIPTVASRKWIMPKFQGFDEKIRDIEGYNFNARYFDRLFLNGLSESEWQAQVKNVQQALTDQLIQEAVRRLPDPIYRLSGKEIASKLLARRDNLMEQAMRYYRFLAKTVDVAASDKDELFKISYGNENGPLTVSIHKKVDNDKRGRLLYQRTFDPAVTKEVRLYGRGDDDTFVVKGQAKTPIKVRLVGGGSDDTFQVEDSFRNRQRLYIYDRSDEDDVFPKASLAKIRTAKNDAINEFDPRAFEYDVVMPLLTVGYNLDDGVLVGAGLLYTRHGFRKKPFAARHRLLLGHALATNATFFRYNGYFTDIWGQTSLSVDVDGRAPNNTSNFFGIGNETNFLEVGDRPIRYYRTRYDFVTSEIKLHRNMGPHLKLNAGLAAQVYNNEASDNEGRFIVSYQEQRPAERIFSGKLFAGAVTGLELDTRSDKMLPSSGVHFDLLVKAMKQLDDARNSFGQAQAAFSFYLNPGGNSHLVLANRVGGGTTIGQPDFYQLLYLSGNNNLRGYRNFRFAGESMLYHNLELRYKLFDFKSYLFPGSVGLIGFHDIGRVWAEGMPSDKWHTGYGGGFYLVPAKLILLQGVVGVSEEDVLPYVSVGFRF
ncbi:BamA/TamA family outer membrane protein [Pontibacter sp. CAU 1760]